MEAPPPLTPPTTVTNKVHLAESYRVQARDVWPGRGQHLLAQFDDHSIVVYQAYKRQIAEYAVIHKKFEGCPSFGMARMTWIKTNFLWMMYRSKWGSRPNQDHVLAIWLKRSAFERYLENAREKGSVRGFQGTVRLQWDPDHLPNGDPHPYRRAVQLGLKGVTSFADGTDILDIQDISEFVHQQAARARAEGKPSKNKGKKTTAGGSETTANEEDLLVARERVYLPTSKLAAEMIQITPAPGDPGEREDD